MFVFTIEFVPGSGPTPMHTHTYLADVDCRQSLTGRVSAGCDSGDHGGLRSCSREPTGLRRGWAGPLEANGAVGATAGAGGRPPPDEGDLHRRIRSSWQESHFFLLHGASLQSIV